MGGSVNYKIHGQENKSKLQKKMQPFHTSKKSVLFKPKKDIRIVSLHKCNLYENKKNTYMAMGHNMWDLRSSI